MASDLSGIMSALVTAIAAANGAGSYTHNLSGVGQVVWGNVENPPMNPFVCMWLEGVDAEHGPDLSSFRRTIGITGIGWVGATADTAIAREQAAADLLDDILTAFEVDVSLGGRLWSAKISGQSFDGSGTAWADRGLVIFRLEAWYVKAIGTGV